MHPNQMLKEGLKPMTIDKAIPVVVTTEEGGPWVKPFAVKYADGTCYDPVAGWHRQIEKVDPVKDWEHVIANDPLVAARVENTGNALVSEIKRLRDKVRELEGQLRPADMDF
jgi:hypothetical protein